MTDKRAHDNIWELRLIDEKHRTLTNKQQCNPEDSKRENSEKRRNKPKAVKRKEQLVVVLDRKLFNESLILAQDERWRRA